MHNKFVENLILQGAVNGNILPLTSACNMKCLFCSHSQNPADLLVYHIPPRDLRDIKETISYMNPACPVIIGESVTRIIEGEPFTHPDIDGVLELIRDYFAETPIRITTNGSLL
ncbi:MAG: radical SAM protein, partial [Peptococcaceae bacterium]|nr:radical SAM protein [Peptococcaceae bacterium]